MGERADEGDHFLIARKRALVQSQFVNRRGQRQNDLLDRFFLLRLQGGKRDASQPQSNQTLPLRENPQNLQAIVRIHVRDRSIGRDPETKRTDVLEPGVVQEPNALFHACGVVDRDVAAEERLRDGSETVGDQGARAYGVKIRPGSLHNHVYHVQWKGRSSGHQEPANQP